MYTTYTSAGRSVKTATVDAAETILGLTIRGRYDRPTRGARPSSPSPLVSDGLADPLGHRRHLALFQLYLEVARLQTSAPAALRHYCIAAILDA